MKFPSANPIQVREAVKAMGLAGYLEEPLESHFPITDVMEFRTRIWNATTNRELRNIKVGNLWTSAVCTIEDDRAGYWVQINRLLRWIEEGITVGEAVQRNFGIMCTIGVKSHCTNLYYDHRYDEIRKPTSGKGVVARGLSAKAANKLGY